MSAIATELVWSCSTAQRGARLVLLALAREADDQGRAVLTLSQIADLTRLSRRSVTTCLKELARSGELSYEPGVGRHNASRFTILLGEPGAAVDGQTTHGHVRRETREDFVEDPSRNGKQRHETGKPLPADAEVSSSRARRVGTPTGSTNTPRKQARSHAFTPGRRRHSQAPVEIPAGARALVDALTRAGMLVGWRLTEEEWARVTVLAARWGTDRLVEMIARRWDPARPPQSARYLLRIWADLPARPPADEPDGNVVPLRSGPGRRPFRNPERSSAYQNGF